MQPVWVLSVDLQTKTATFQSGLGDAARSARGAFTDIKSGSNDMGRGVSGNMMEARHGVMLLGEEFGVHLPRALTTFIASIGPVGAAMEAAFPFLAIAVGATLLIEHLAKIHEAGAKLTDDQMKFGTAAQNAFNQLDEKILQAQIKADELRKDHLGALKGELELIDKQSMEELVHSFEEVAKAAEVVFADLKTSWYQFGAGSEGAKHALDSFQAQYERLRSLGDEAGMSGLLSGTLAQAQKLLGLQTQLNKLMFGPDKKFNDVKDTAQVDSLKAQIAAIATKAGWGDKELAAQQQLVQALQDQEGIEQRIASLKTLQKSNFTTEAHQAEGKDAGKRLREDIDAGKQAGEDAGKAFEGFYRQSVEALQESEKEKIDATKEGSAQRLAAINAAIAEEEAAGQKGEGYYRSLTAERVNLIRQMAEDEAKLRSEAAREDAEDEQKMGELALAAEKQANALKDSARRETIQQKTAEELTASEAEYQLKMTAYAKELAALDKSDKEYENKLKAIHDKEKQLTQQHENELTAIKEKAEIERNQRILSAEDRFNDDVSRGLAQVIMGHQTFAKMVTQFGNQVVSGMIQNAIKSMMAMDMTKEKDAAHAARKAFNIGMDIGGPAGIVLGPVFGAAAFAAVMAFNRGTDSVPGYGSGDSVPAMLTPGEGVVPKGVMEGLSNMAKFGGMGGGGHTYHVHVRPTYHVQTIDGDGMQDALEKHTDQLQRHFENTIRKMNR